MTSPAPDGPRFRRLPRDLSDPLTRRVILLLTAVLGGLAAIDAILLWRDVTGHPGGLGVDFYQYRGHLERWLSTGQLYLPHQLAGPTPVGAGDPLYPPVVVYLLAPFQVLPAIVWWIVPLAVVGYVLVRLRPVLWVWPILALIALWPRTPALVFYGNPGMWAVAAVAGGVMWSWPGPLVLFKPSLAPFALVGIGTRGWLVTLVVVIVASLPQAGLWRDYLTVLRNSAISLDYSLLDLPVMFVPIVAWLGRSDRTVGWQLRPLRRSAPDRDTHPGASSADGPRSSQ